MTARLIQPAPVIRASAVFSGCRRYRYRLDRAWAQGRGTVAFIGLNPSTADESTDDPTLKRCIGFARGWGFSAMVMLNLFAYRATSPADMLRRRNPVGGENDNVLAASVGEADLVVACWGNHGSHRGRDREVLGRFGNVHALALTAHGMPSHPLYLPRGLRARPLRDLQFSNAKTAKESPDAC